MFSQIFTENHAESGNKLKQKSRTTKKELQLQIHEAAINKKRIKVQ
jgi:hypothetical protein